MNMYFYYYQIPSPICTYQGKQAQDGALLV